MNLNGVVLESGPRPPSEPCFCRAPSLRSGFEKQCYTARFPHMLTLAPRRVWRALLPLILFLAGSLPPSQAAQPTASALETAAQDFVQQILSRNGSPATVTVTFQNASSQPAETIQAAENAIFSSFRNSGVRLVKPEMALAEVQITFSEDWQSYDWIAQIKEGSTSQLVIKKFPRVERTAASRVPTMTLRRYTLWQQEGPILDFFVDNQNLALLEPDQVSLYGNDSGQWRGHFTLGIPHTEPWPRDLRGRLKIKDGQITAFLPGILCTGSMSPPSLDCRASDDPWQLDQGQLVAFYSSRRNFFNGILAGPSAGASVVPFFSGAEWNSHDQRQWVFAGTDGRARLYLNDLTAPATVFNAWGSSLAAVNSKCGSGWQLLVTTPADTTRADAVQAIEIDGREAAPASVPIELSGPVTALWTSTKNAESVNGVMQSRSTGKYEAFVLTVNCN